MESIKKPVEPHISKFIEKLYYLLMVMRNRETLLVTFMKVKLYLLPC